MVIKYSEDFRNDLREILRFIRQDKPEAAKRFKQKVKSLLRKLQDFPELGKAVDNPYFPEGTRRLSIENYLLFYHVEGSEIIVAALLHGARDIEAILGKR